MNNQRQRRRKRNPNQSLLNEVCVNDHFHLQPNITGLPENLKRRDTQARDVNIIEMTVLLPAVAVVVMTLLLVTVQVLRTLETEKVVNIEDTQDLGEKEETGVEVTLLEEIDGGQDQETEEQSLPTSGRVEESRGNVLCLQIRSCLYSFMV